MLLARGRKGEAGVCRGLCGVSYGEEHAAGEMRRPEGEGGGEGLLVNHNEVMK